MPWGIRDISGMTFGRLTAIRVVGYYGKHRNAIWLCECECGGEKEIRGASLTARNKGTKSCGCLARELAAARLKEIVGPDAIGFGHHRPAVNFKDLRGQRFGKWAVIERVQNDKHGNTYWLCECSCQARTRRVVESSSLLEGHSTSCCGSNRFKPKGNGKKKRS